MTTVAEYAAARELLGNLTQRELRGKYKRSALGWAWSLINPLALAVIFTSWVVSLLIELAVLGIALLAFGNVWLQYLPLLLVVIALQTVFATGIGLLLAALNVYFRDVQHFVGIFLQLWFYATPVIYPITLLGNIAERDVFGVSLLTLYKLNPMTAFVEMYHQMLFYLQWPDWELFLYAAVVSFATLAFGLLVFKRLEPRFAEEL
jgi:ABC-2 type transport system permease protein